jgi:hypothetical protein
VSQVPNVIQKISEYNLPMFDKINKKLSGINQNKEKRIKIRRDKMV